MSYSLLECVFRQKLPSGEKLVLLALIQRADRESGGCFVLLSTLQAMTGFKRRAVINWLGSLQKRGYVVRTERPGRSSVYQLVAPRILAGAGLEPDTAPGTGAPSARVVEMTGAPSAPPRALNAPTGAPSAPTGACSAPISLLLSPLDPFTKTPEGGEVRVLHAAPPATRPPEANPGARNPEPGRFGNGGGGGSEVVVNLSPEERSENLRKLAALGVAAIKPISHREACLAAHKDLPRFGRSPFP